jgi:uncharacterized protein (TIGR03000 family)
MVCEQIVYLPMVHKLAAIAILSACVAGPLGGQSSPPGQPVYLRVLVPSPKAQVTIDGAATRQSGSERWFVSPPLEPCRSYSYTVAVTWPSNSYTFVTRTRQVAVRAGQTIQVDVSSPAREATDQIVVAYVQTPEKVIQAMLRLAEVGPEDVVYDLGCGDGSLVIAAVKDFRAKRGVGVDIDPDLVAEAQANARKQGVAERVVFRQQDVLKIKDLSEASVVLLYIGDELNQRLRPVLQKTLKPGARIVSHRFLMGDWKPLRSEKVKSGNFEYDIHLWKIDAGKE